MDLNHPEGRALPSGMGRSFASQKPEPQSHAAPSTTSSASPEPLTFAGLAAYERAELLPFLGLQTGKSPSRCLSNLHAFMEENPVLGTQVELTGDDGYIVRTIFEVYSPGDDYDDFIDTEELEIVLLEDAPGASISAFGHRRDKPLSLAEATVEINAAMYIVWLAISPHSNRRNQPAFISELHAEFSGLKTAQVERSQQRNKLAEELAHTKLDSLTFIMNANFADGVDIKDKVKEIFSPAIEFDDLLPNDKIEKTDTQKKAVTAWQNSDLAKIGVPEFFFQPINSAYSLRQEFNTINGITESIRYHFSNGTSLTAREILMHPMAVLVPQDLLPGKPKLPNAHKFWSKTFSKPTTDETNQVTKNILNEIKLASDQRQTWNPWVFISQPYEAAVLEILRNAVLRLERGELNIALAFRETGPEEKARKSSGKSPNNSLLVLRKSGSAAKKAATRLPLKKIELGNNSELYRQFYWRRSLDTTALKSDPSLQMITAKYSLELRGNASADSPMTSASSMNLLPLENGFLDLHSRTLWLKSLRSELAEFQRMAHGPDESLHPDLGAVRVEFQTWPQYQVKFTARGPQAVKDLDRTLQLQSALSYDFPLIPIDTLNATPEIHLRPDGSFIIARRVEPNQDSITSLSCPFVYGLSPITLNSLKTLSQGFSNHFKSEAREMAARKKLFRDFELKLLKHQGIVNLLLFETLNARFHGALSDGVLVKNPEDILRHLEVKILALLGELSTTSTSLKLTDYCSKSIYNKLRSFIADYYSSSINQQFSTFLPEGEVVLQRFIDDEQRLLLAILEYGACASKGEIFARPRINLLQLLVHQPIDPAIDQTREQPGYEKPHSLESRVSAFQVQLARERISIGPEKTTLRLPFADKVAEASGQGKKEQLRQTLLAFQTLSKNGFEIFFNGQKLKELGQDDFRTELNLVDEAENDSQPKNSSKKVALGVQRFDWFELHPKFFLHGKELAQAEAQKLLNDGMIEHNGQYYLIPASRMPSLKKLSDFWLRLQKGKKTKGNFADGQPIYPLEKSQVLEMLALRTSGIAVLGGAKWKEICSFYDSLDQTRQDFSLPNSVHATLKHYQEIGVQRLYDLYRLGLGAVLADDMGLGKTLQALAFLEKLRVENRMGATLIVVPTSLTYNWLSERDKFVPELPMLGFSPKAKDSASHFLQTNQNAVLLTTYGLLQEHREFFQQFNWNVVLFDEAQNLKNIVAQRTTTARALNANIKICLTGTPLENHLGEFYSLLDLAVPGCLGEFDQFRQTYVNPSSILLADIEYLKLKSRPLVLRRTKNEILSELPEKQESRVVLPFEEKQKTIYRDIAISYNEKIQQAIAEQGESKCQLQMLTALLRLRQACSDPGALPGVKYNKTPPKLESLLESLSEIVDAGESALVFTQFLHTMERVSSALRDAGLPTFVLHGGLSRSQREDALQQFHVTKGGGVLVMTLKTGGVGLNLTKASYVFHLEPWWNPAVENQATDRAHRIGQKRAVQVYRYIMHDSVEEKIESLKSQKQQRFDIMFTESEMPDAKVDDQQASRISSHGTHLSKDDFSFLLKPS